MTPKKNLCFYCENKRFLLGNQPYICMITQDALYLLKKPRNIKVQRVGDQNVLEMDEDTFLSAPELKAYRAENVADYSCFVSYDESELDITPLEEAQKYATIFFRDKETGKRITLRCVCDVEELRALADPIFNVEPEIDGVFA